MKKKNKGKEVLIDYLLSRPGENITRDTIIKDTGISKSRLSELINEIRSDGYEIITPNRSGIVRLETTGVITSDITPKEVRQWLILLALSKLGSATRIELIYAILSIADSIYWYEGTTTENNYSDMKILKYLEKYNPAAKQDIVQYLPLPTFRKDLHDLIQNGFIDMKRCLYKNGTHFVYSISEKAPTILFVSEDTLYEFVVFYDNFKSFPSNTEPLESLYKKSTYIYDWDSDAAIQMYGKLNRIDKEQLICLNNFVKYPYKTKTLHINYRSHTGLMDITIASALLFYSVETNCFYLLCVNTNSKDIIQLRLDRIVSILEGKAQNNIYRSQTFLDIYEEMFSSSFEREKSHVKVIFEDFGNIRERITALHNKRRFSKLYDIEPPDKDIPHCIVYEDDLRGISDFSRYLRSFGSSALVLEPSCLKKLMIKSNQQILNNYEGITDEN